MTSANVPATHAVSSTQNTSTFKESEAARSVGVTTSEQVTGNAKTVCLIRLAFLLMYFIFQDVIIACAKLYFLLVFA